MATIFEPPALVSVAVALAATGGAVYLGLRPALRRPLPSVTGERDEVWGTDDPAPPPKQPYVYPSDRVVDIPDEPLPENAPAPALAGSTSVYEPPLPGARPAPYQPFRHLEPATEPPPPDSGARQGAVWPGEESTPDFDAAARPGYAVPPVAAASGAEASDATHNAPPARPAQPTQHGRPTPTAARANEDDAEEDDDISLADLFRARRRPPPPLRPRPPDATSQD